MFGRVLFVVSGFYSNFLQMLGASIQSRGKKKYELEFILAGGKQVIPYLWSVNRFIWKDQKADMIFLKYQKVMRRIYVDPKLEIKIFE